MADGTDSCAPSVLVSTELEDGVEKLCGVCKVPVSIHVGKPGVGKCLGGAFTKAFETLVKTVQGISAELQTERSEAKKEREEAKDREVRLNMQLRELRNEVSDLKGEIELLKERCISALTENEMLKSLDRRTTSIMQDVKKLSSESTTSSGVNRERSLAKEKTSWADATGEYGHQSDRTNATCKPSEKAGKENAQARVRSRSTENKQTRTTSDSDPVAAGWSKVVSSKAPKKEELSVSPHARSKPRRRAPTIKPTSTPLGQLRGAVWIDKKVFYVGGVSPECSSEDLRVFCQTHCQAQVIQCDVIPSRRYGTVSARLVVQAEDGPAIEALEWPEHVFARPWSFLGPPSPNRTSVAPTNRPNESAPEGPANSISEPTSTEGASASSDAGTQENESPNPDQRKDKQQ